jgi:GxxExxY protein
MLLLTLCYPVYPVVKCSYFNHSAAGFRPHHRVTQGEAKKCVGNKLATNVYVMKRNSQTDLYLPNRYSGQVVSAAMEVHSKLGPGLLESAYEACLLMELKGRGLSVESQVVLPLTYQETLIDLGYRIDVLVERSVIVELKAVQKVDPLHQAQLLSYLKLSGFRVGLLINFNTVSLKNGIHRMIN